MVKTLYRCESCNKLFKDYRKAKSHESIPLSGLLLFPGEIFKLKKTTPTMREFFQERDLISVVNSDTLISPINHERRYMFSNYSVDENGNIDTESECGKGDLLTSNPLFIELNYNELLSELTKKEYERIMSFNLDKINEELMEGTTLKRGILNKNSKHI